MQLNAPKPMFPARIALGFGISILAARCRGHVVASVPCLDVVGVVLGQKPERLNQVQKKPHHPYCHHDHPCISGHDGATCEHGESSNHRRQMLQFHGVASDLGRQAQGVFRRLPAANDSGRPGGADTAGHEFQSIGELAAAVLLRVKKKAGGGSMGQQSLAGSMHNGVLGGDAMPLCGGDSHRASSPRRARN